MGEFINVVKFGFSGFDQRVIQTYEKRTFGTLLLFLTEGSVLSTI